MTLYNSQDTFPCYDPRASTLFWYLPQVTAKSDPCIDYQVLWSRATWNHLKSSEKTVEDLVLLSVNIIILLLVFRSSVLLNDLTFWETFGDLNIFMVPWPLSLITEQLMEWWGSDFWPRLLAYGRLLAVSNKEAAGGENNYSLKSRHRPQHPTPFLWGRAINFTRICHHTLAKGTRRLSGVEA